MRYFLLGYMGSGKTTLGKALSEHLGVDFVDLDVRITAEIGRSIVSFMEDRGELAFRKVEHTVLERLLSESQEDVVVALGGGTPVFYNHMEALNAAGTTVFLDVSVVELARRLEKDVDRPLIKDKDDVAEFVAKHLFERRPFYSLAQHRVKGDALTVEAILEAIG
ncbi:MAG: AAA family ATPase [Schleiferiaceae bacterium]|jgi:shikimate kinase|nr:AAA family ATPase [Schleiferiaceae bacterium]